MKTPKPVFLTLHASKWLVAPATLTATLHCIVPLPSNEVECISLTKRLDFDHKLLIFEKRDAAARPVQRSVFLHVLLLNCDYNSLKMFQIRKSSMNIFEIYKNISFNIYFKIYKHYLYLLLIYVYIKMIRVLDQLKNF